MSVLQKLEDLLMKQIGRLLVEHLPISKRVKTNVIRSLIVYHMNIPHLTHNHAESLRLELKWRVMEHQERLAMS